MAAILLLLAVRSISTPRIRRQLRAVLSRIAQQRLVMEAGSIWALPLSRSISVSSPPAVLFLPIAAAPSCPAPGRVFYRAPIPHRLDVLRTRTFGPSKARFSSARMPSAASMSRNAPAQTGAPSPTFPPGLNSPSPFVSSGTTPGRVSCFSSKQIFPPSDAPQSGRMTAPARVTFPDCSECSLF